MSGKGHAPRPLDAKSSAGELWSEVRRLRSLSADGAEPEAARLSAELERERARGRALLSEVRAARAETFDLGVAGLRVGGKAAPAQFRTDTWRRFANATLRLPRTREEEGLRYVRLFVAKNLVADLYLLGLQAPRGPLEAKERDRIRRVLDSPSFVALLSRPEPAFDRLRILFLSQAARAFYRPSVWAVFERGSEDVRRDAYGTVLK
jgi:hypothetical protein